MSLFSPQSQAIFQSAQRERENPPELDEPEAQALPYPWTCPHCRKYLDMDDDGPLAWCKTPGCKYDNGISEEANRRLWQDAQP